MAEDNPFLALFEASPNLPKQKKMVTVTEGNSKVVQRMNDIIEDIFCFTINAYGLLGRASSDPVKVSGLVILESVALELQHEQNGRTWLGLDILGQALFERLLMSKEDLKKSLMTENESQVLPKKNHAIENNVIVFLAEAYFRAQNLQNALNKRVSHLSTSPLLLSKFQNLLTSSPIFSTLFDISIRNCEIWRICGKRP